MLMFRDPCLVLCLYTVEYAFSFLVFQGPLSMGCSVLDSWLRGGLLVSSLTEIAGISSAGKTQICLQLALTVQLPRNIGGLDGQAVYICTEDAFPNRRLYQLAEMFCRNHLDLGHSSKFYTDRIFVTHCSTAVGFPPVVPVRSMLFPSLCVHCSAVNHTLIYVPCCVSLSIPSCQCTCPCQPWWVVLSYDCLRGRSVNLFNQFEQE